MRSPASRPMDPPKKSATHSRPPFLHHLAGGREEPILWIGHPNESGTFETRRIPVFGWFERHPPTRCSRNLLRGAGPASRRRDGRGHVLRRRAPRSRDFFAQHVGGSRIRGARPRGLRFRRRTDRPHAAGNPVRIARRRANRESGVAHRPGRRGQEPCTVGALVARCFDHGDPRCAEQDPYGTQDRAGAACLAARAKFPTPR